MSVIQSETTSSEPRPETKIERRRARTRALAISVIAVVVLTSALIAGTLPRLQRENEVNATAAESASAPPRVTIAIAKRVATDAERLLPGTTLPLLEAPLYARTTGYLKRRTVDIGDRVKEGELLAEISAPDVDDQLAQARANLAQARANLKLSEATNDLAKVTLARDLKSGVGVAVTLEQIDQDRAKVQTTAAQIEANKASIGVNEAAVQRFTDLQGFQKITAPFAGVITARNVDPGDLISADSPSTTKELFHVMRTDVLRVWVNVPQVFSTGIKVGQDAILNRREDPQRTFKGKVTRTADALDPNTRTLLTEVQVANPDDALRPGMYLQVKFIFSREFLPVRIPTAALAIRTTGPLIAVLDDKNTVRYRKVQLGRDYGAEIDVTAGLKEGEKVIVHPGDDLPEGTVVQALPMPTK